MDPRGVARAAAGRRHAAAPVIVRTVAQTRVALARTIEAEAGLRRTRGELQDAASGPLRRDLVGAIGLQHVLARVRLHAVRVLHQLAVVPLRGGRYRVAALADVRL